MRCLVRFSLEDESLLPSQTICFQGEQRKCLRPVDYRNTLGQTVNTNRVAKYGVVGRKVTVIWNRKQLLNWPGIKPGPPTWQARILPLWHTHSNSFHFISLHAFVSPHVSCSCDFCVLQKSKRRFLHMCHFWPFSLPNMTRATVLFLDFFFASNELFNTGDKPREGESVNLVFW